MDTNAKNTIRGTISPTAEKWIRGAAIFAMIIVALASAILSFDGLQKLALASQVPERLAFLFPIAIDVTILMGSLAVLLYELFNLKAFFGWFTVLFGTALSVTGNVISVSDAGLVAQVLHGIIPILLCISLESLLRILRFNIRRTVVLEEPVHIEENATVDGKTTEGKVLENSFWADTPDPNLLSNLEESKAVASAELTTSKVPVIEMESKDLVEPTVENTSSSVLYAAQPTAPTLIEPVLEEEKVVKKTVTQAPSKKATAALSPKSSNGKKPRKTVVPLESQELESLKEMLNTFPEEYPTFKKLGEVLKVKSEIPLADIRYILGYPKDKRVDSLVKNARDFASEI